MIELVGSEVVARRPTDISVETAFEDDEEAMPIPRALTEDEEEMLTPCALTEDDEEAMPTPRALTEDVVIDPYQTPVALTPANRRNKATVMAEPQDTTMESSDTELVTFEDLKKRRALTNAAGKSKVCTSFVIFLILHLYD